MRDKELNIVLVNFYNNNCVNFVFIVVNSLLINTKF